MDISLDKPGFSDEIRVEVHDAPKSSGSSPACSGHPQRSCSRRSSRMSSFDRDIHLICTRCRGFECSVELRCEECECWSKEEMLAHEKYRKSLASKSKGRGKNSNKSSKVPASPPKTSANVDLETRFEAQYEQISHDIDIKMDQLSLSLLGQISSLFDQLHHPNPLVSEDTSALPGYSGAQTEPAPPQPLDKSASAWRREDQVREGGTGARVSGLAHAQESSGRNYKPRVAQPPASQESFTAGPSGSGAYASGREHCGVDDDNDDFEDRDSIAGAPGDANFARLVDYIYNRFPHAKPDAAAIGQPHCEYEQYFSVSETPEPTHKFLKLYPRISEIQSVSGERAARFSRESRPLFRILPLNRRSIPIGDDSGFCHQRFLNSDYSRICRAKSVPRSRAASVNISDLERLERAACVILAGDSQCFWFLSALLAQLKDDGCRPSNPSLFDRSISALSAALAAQTSVAANISEFVTTKRRESYLAHASFTLPDNLKRELLVAPSTDSLLFNQSLLSTAIENMKEDSLLSSTSSLAVLSKAASKNKLQGGTSRYTSPLDAPRAGSSGFHKRSASPYRRGRMLLPQPRARVFGGRSHAPVQPQ